MSVDSTDPRTTYIAQDPVVSSHFTPFSPSVSRARPHHGAAGPSHSQGHSSQSMPQDAAVQSETAPLLGGSRAARGKKPFYRPRPLWLVPFAVIASITRGMTLAPRVQVYTQLACNAVYGHDVYDHTSNGSRPTISPHSALSSSTIDSYAHSYDIAHPVIDEHGTQPMYIRFPASSGGDDEDEPDPRSVPSKRCMSDARVQSGAARIQTTMTTVMGTLSALTTGWWGQLGEKYGRTRVLAAATLGLFLTDLTFILVSTPHSIFAAHGHKLLIISPLIEGFLGGWSTLQAATTAYVSDCTSDGSRSQIFSRFSGVFYLGFSIGPMLGAYLIRHPIIASPSPAGHGPVLHNGAPTVTSVFYVGAMCSFVNLLLVLFVFPESLDKKRAKAAGKHVDRVVAVPVPAPQAQGDTTADPAAVNVGILRFMGPLSLLAPKRLPRPEGGYRRDWSLTALGFGLFMFLLATGIFQIKYLYAEHVYEWGAEQLSYYITLMGAVRAVHLLFVMPHLIGWFKPKPKITPTVSSGNPTPSGKHTTPAAGKKAKPTLGQLAKEINFDLVLLRSSFFIECMSHTLVALMPGSSSSALFVAFTTLSCLGTGVHPAVNSLALCILQIQGDVMSAAGMKHDGADTGRLFGALAAIQAVGQMILGPLIFGVVYSSTVATFPKAIFATAAGITLVALVLVCLLRPDVALQVKQQRRARREEAERGRSRVSKDLGIGGSQSSSPRM